MASGMARPQPSPYASPLRRPAPDPAHAHAASASQQERPWSRALGAGPMVSPPASLTPLLDAVGRTRRLALALAQRGGADSTSCICQRPHAVVLCHVCGWYSRCRLMKTCHEHPNTRFLLDMMVCPRCRAPSYQMDEYEMGNEHLSPCPLLMPEPANGPAPSSQRPMSPEGVTYYAAGARALAVPAQAAAAAATPPRARMRPPLQSDSQGMQRKHRDSLCAQQLPRTPSGLPVSMYYDEASSYRGSPAYGYGSAYGGAGAGAAGSSGRRKLF